MTANIIHLPPDIINKNSLYNDDDNHDDDFLGGFDILVFHCWNWEDKTCYQP